MAKCPKMSVRQGNISNFSALTILFFWTFAVIRGQKQSVGFFNFFSLTTNKSPAWAALCHWPLVAAVHGARPRSHTARLPSLEDRLYRQDSVGAQTAYCSDLAGLPNGKLGVAPQFLSQQTYQQPAHPHPLHHRLISVYISKQCSLQNNSPPTSPPKSQDTSHRWH